MLNVYTLHITAICPVDMLPDVYRLRVRANRVIPVEDILAAAKKATATAAYQEDITQALHRALACEVTTAGWHSGVKTVCRCGEA
jgi:hypothetical protein